MSNSQISTEALETYLLFKHKLAQAHGSKAAKPPTIQTLIDICRRLEPKRVLEIGGGNGTITFTILKHSAAQVDVYEQLEFCREQIRRNLVDYIGRFRLIESYSILPPERDYDLVVIDGGEAHDDAKGYGEVVWLFLSYLRSIKVVYIEGRRGLQRKQVRLALSRKGYYGVVRHPDMLIPSDLDIPDDIVEWKKAVFAGGQEIRVTLTDSAILKLANYVFWEVLIGLNALAHRVLVFARKTRRRLKKSLQ